jgi:lysophospholipase L1-like esterase
MALAGGDASPLVTELDALHPQWALVMYGTNDLDHVDVGTYRGTMVQLLDVIEGRSVVPVLYTIPPRQDAPDRGALSVTFADAIRSLAAERHIPLIDYNAALLALPGNHGISDDGIHPNIYVDPTSDTGDSCVFVPDALGYGYNVRNLLTLQMLARLASSAQ